MPNITPWLETLGAQELDTGGSSWFSPENTLNFDGAEAVSGPIGAATGGVETNILSLAGADHGIDFAAPQPPVLLGVEAEVRGRWTGAVSGLKFITLRSVVGQQVRMELGSGNLPLETPGVMLKGGPTDRMGFSEADLMNPLFGFELWGRSQTTEITGSTLRIDAVRLRLYWNNPPAAAAGWRRRSRTRRDLARESAP